MANTGEAEGTARRSQWPLAVLAPALLLALGCAYAIFFCSSTRDISGHAIGSDDSYISYRYAQNWVAGEGLVFNPGERVEGYTNLLYVLLMGLPFVAHWDVFAFSVVVNSLFAIGTLLLLMHHVRARLGVRSAVLAGFLYALSPSVWIWASAGLETPLVVLLQVAIWVTMERLESEPTRRDRVLLCLCVGLLVLTRADGFITGGIALGYLLVKNKRREALAVLVTLACVVGGLFAWRLSYYHQVWPNTYYAKIGASVLSRLKSSIRELGGVGARQGLAVYFVSIVFCAAAAAARLRRTGLLSGLKELRFGVAFAVLWIAYWLYVGGDNFEDRFLIVLIPIGIALLLEAILGSSGAAVQHFVVAATVIVQLSVPVREDQYGKSLTPKYDFRVELGKFLARTRPGRLLATPAAGKIPFFSGLTTIDMLGLTDPVIARAKIREFVPGHSKHDDDYVLSRRPDLIATTFTGDGLDAGEGLPVAKYQGAGYHIRFIVNSSPHSFGADNILDTTGRSDAELVLRAHTGWSTVVLERTDAHAEKKADPGT